MLQCQIRFCQCLFLVLASIVISGCNKSLPYGYSYGPGIDSDIPGDWLRLPAGQKSAIAMNTMIIQHELLDDYLVGVGLPAKIGSYICHDENGIAKGEGGIIYRVESDFDYFVFDLESGLEEHYSSYDEMLVALNRYNLPVNSFDSDYAEGFREQVLSNSRVNRSVPYGCMTYL